jgi:hypothetical protein
MKVEPPPSRGTRDLPRPNSGSARKPVNQFNFLALTAIGGLLLAFGAGCIFDPPTKPPGIKVAPPYPVRTSAKNAILYLKAAWEKRDSTMADTVYAPYYVGKSYDQGVPLPDFAKSDEVRALGGVQISQAVTGVTMDFHDPSTWVRQTYSQDSTIWVAYSIPSPRIVVDTNSSSLVADASTFFEFKVSPYVFAPGDTLWYIVRWTEQ